MGVGSGGVSGCQGRCERRCLKIQQKKMGGGVGSGRGDQDEGGIREDVNGEV